MPIPYTIAQLTAPIETLGFSEGFVKYCKRRNYKHLEDIIAIGSDGLIADPNIDLGWFSELTEFLRNNFALHLLESKAK